MKQQRRRRKKEGGAWGVLEVLSRLSVAGPGGRSTGGKDGHALADDKPESYSHGAVGTPFCVPPLDRSIYYRCSRMVRS